MTDTKGQYQVILGTFIENEFIWHNVKEYDDLTEAYKGFKKYVNDQLKYTDEELKKVWDTGRLDIELRKGNKLLNWVGIYAREVDKLSQAEEKKADEDKPEKTEKKNAKDSADYYNKDHGVYVAKRGDRYYAYEDIGDLEYDDEREENEGFNRVYEGFWQYSSKDVKDLFRHSSSSDNIYTNSVDDAKKDRNLRVCERCKYAIEAHEGKQIWKEVEVGPRTRCDWCDDYGFVKLYELLGNAE